MAAESSYLDAAREIAALPEQTHSDRVEYLRTGRFPRRTKPVKVTGSELAAAALEADIPSTTYQNKPGGIFGRRFSVQGWRLNPERVEEKDSWGKTFALLVTDGTQWQYSGGYGSGSSLTKTENSAFVYDRDQLEKFYTGSGASWANMYKTDAVRLREIEERQREFNRIAYEDE